MFKGTTNIYSNDIRHIVDGVASGTVADCEEDDFGCSDEDEELGRRRPKPQRVRYEECRRSRHKEKRS